MCMPVFVFVFIDIISVCLEVEVDDDEEVLIFDESRDLNCDSVSLLIQRSVSTLINLVKVIDRVANVPTTSSAGILCKWVRFILNAKK